MGLNDFFQIVKTFIDIPKSIRAGDHWFETATIDNVYEQFLHVAIHGLRTRPGVPYNLLKPSEIQNFDIAVSTCSQTTSGDIDMSDFLHLLYQAFPMQVPYLQAAQPSLRALLYAHARFPFSRPVPLTRDALLRAVMLLTERGGLFFSRAAIGPARRTASDRLTYIFNALATPAAGVGIVDLEGVVDVLKRLPFPLPSLPTLGTGGRKHEDFERMAQRLDPLCDDGVEKPVQVTSNILAPLASLAVSFTGKAEDSCTATTSLTLEQFLTWGTTAQLLEALDQLFGAILQPSHDIESEKQQQDSPCL